MKGQNKGRPKPGFGFLIGLLTLILISGMVGELHPAGAMQLMTGSAPTAADDTFGFRKGQPYTASAPGVLANDTDPEGDVISAIPIENGSTSPAGSGTYTLYANGSFIFTPSGGSITQASFTYTIIDSPPPQTESNTATVTLVG